MQHVGLVQTNFHQTGSCMGGAPTAHTNTPKPPPVLVAEVVQHYFPRMVELHNYSAANSLQQKLYNWSTLNTKLFRKLGFQLPREEQAR
jgi:hypothetical protein